MPRESAEEKALRLISERRVDLLFVADSVVNREWDEEGTLHEWSQRNEAEWPIRAHVRGDDLVYSVGWQSGTWRCSCEANSRFGRRCSHIRAVALVVVPPG